MIPANGHLIQDFVSMEYPSKTYKMNLNKQCMSGNTDQLDAVKQAIFKILNSERYRYLIYSWNYGVETEDLFGEPVSYVCPELKRRITESLIQDKRITGIDNFTFDIEKGKVNAKFMVHTIFGDAEMQKGVTV